MTYTILATRLYYAAWEAAVSLEMLALLLLRDIGKLLTGWANRMLFDGQRVLDRLEKEAI